MGRGTPHENAPRFLEHLSPYLLISSSPHLSVSYEMSPVFDSGHEGREFWDRRGIHLG